MMAVISSPFAQEETERTMPCSVGGSLDIEPFPTFNNVGRVAIFVEITKQDKRINLEELPAPVQKENLERMLKQIYEKRYAKLDKHLWRSTPGCYDKNGQPVTVQPFVTQEDRQKAKEISLDVATLTVYLHIDVITPEKASFKIVNYRPNVHQPFWRSWLNMPVDFWDYGQEYSVFSRTFDLDLTMSKPDLEKHVYDYVIGWIF